MTPFSRAVQIELRKQIDTVGAWVGYGVLVATVVACGAFGVSAVTRVPSFEVGELIVMAGLPAALTSSIVGVVIGVGDAARGGERDGVLSGNTRGRLYVARGAACGIVTGALVLFTIVVAASCTVTAVLIGGRISTFALVGAIGQVAALAFSSATFGFGIGATVRSLALGLVSVVLLVLVLDVVLTLLGPWSEYVRFSTLQSGLTGMAPAVPTATSGLIWVLIPVVVGWFRTRAVST
ncbi:hypothetical protein EDF24_0260 [Curtobacterium sp. PhB130]|uniref:hypothetical protein n=1 Tax=unclassified Curtobacterium TaxID=257496 RepID=UPI000F4C3CC4|nr:MULTISPECIES: hypothetical protein [unclassified Curtobacterium]ROS77504.1 hypothetical protein EDF24_0260 [Curtobacterium sp. PhB130]TCK66290.1 hypothetical protein EDF27_1043 [Curtobacterium sp. PhB136]